MSKTTNTNTNTTNNTNTTTAPEASKEVTKATPATKNGNKKQQQVGFNEYLFDKELYNYMITYFHYYLLVSNLCDKYSNDNKALKEKLDNKANEYLTLHPTLTMDDFSKTDDAVAIQTSIARNKALSKSIRAAFNNIIDNVGEYAKISSLYTTFKNEGRLTDRAVKEWVTSLCHLKEWEHLSFKSKSGCAIIGKIQGAVGTQATTTKASYTKGTFTKVNSKKAFAAAVIAAFVEFYNATFLSVKEGYLKKIADFDKQLSFEDENGLLMSVATWRHMKEYAENFGVKPEKKKK